jgi:hypothetical protein
MGRNQWTEITRFWTQLCEPLTKSHFSSSPLLSSPGEVYSPAVRYTEDRRIAFPLPGLVSACLNITANERTPNKFQFHTYIILFF